MDNLGASKKPSKGIVSPSEVGVKGLIFCCLEQR